MKRPRTRAECADGPRPCPWVGCQYHLALDLVAISRPDRNPPSSIRFNQLRPPTVLTEASPARTFRRVAEAALAALEQAEQTCALDVADWGGATLTEIAELVGASKTHAHRLVNEAADKAGTDDQELADELRRHLHGDTMGEREREDFDRTRRAILAYRGDRVACNTLQRAIVAHLEINHPNRSMDQIRRTAPADYDLYRAAMEMSR